jgi:hypothetical protein
MDARKQSPDNRKLIKIQEREQTLIFEIDHIDNLTASNLFSFLVKIRK